MLDKGRGRLLPRTTSISTLTPGAHLRAEIERLGLDQVQVADATDVSRQTINNIVNGRQPISRAMAARLGRMTGRSSDYWLQSSFPTDEPALSQNCQTDAAAGRHEPSIRPRGVAVLVNHQIVRAVESGIISIEPFSPEHVRRASLDLRLDDFVITTDGEHIDITEGQTFTLKAGQAVNVGTKEWIEFPLDYVGRVGAMTQLARFGIVTLHGFQVEPGFKGNLQFCLFNAGGADFALRSGIPVISLEIMPLTATPAHDPDTTEHSRASADREPVTHPVRPAVCSRLIHDAIRRCVAIETVDAGVSAQIPDLEIEIIERNETRAADGAVNDALATLRLLRTTPAAAVELRQRYAAFFGEIAARITLSVEQARSALRCLGLPADDSDGTIVTLRNGATAVLHLPAKPARITLKHLARQLREDTGDLILLLAGATSPNGGHPSR